MKTIPSDTDVRLRIGQLAERTGKTVRALHFYEELEIVAPVERTKGGFRLYTEQAVLRVQWIDRLQQLGFSLSEIRDFFASFKAEPAGPVAMEQLRDFYSEKLVETRATLARLQDLEKELEESLTYLQLCEQCTLGTPRSACSPCDQHAEAGVKTPTMVAALHDGEPAH